MSDLLLNLAPPLILSASVTYAATVWWRNRRRRQLGLPPRRQRSMTEARRRLFDEIEGEKRTRGEIEQIMRDAHTKFGPLFETPTQEKPARERIDH